MQDFLFRFKRRSIFIFVILFAITLPFPLSFFPSPGEFSHAFFQQLNHWTAEYLFGLKSNLNMEIESDSIGLYFHLFNLLIIAVISGLIWTLVFKRGNETKLKYIVNATAAYILAFFLLKYGFDKVFKFQFYFPEPNTLYTPLGFLSKDILFWSTVGSSYSYSVFSGIIEVLPALLLFSRKTRLLGGLIAFGVMLHVLLINFSFDISVKVLSMYLLVLSILVIGPYLKSLLGVFFLRRNDFQRPEIELINARKTRLIRFMKALAIVCILFESLYTYVEKNQFNDDLVKRPPFHGAYQLIENGEFSLLDSTNKQSVYFGDLSEIKRVFIHRRGYFILQFQDETMQDYQAVLSPSDMRVKTNRGFVKVKIHIDSKMNFYHFGWEENSAEFNLVGNQIDLKKLPLLQKQFNWMVD